MMAFMPTTLTGLVLFVVLLLPGFAYVTGKERHTTGQRLSPFRETAAVVAASVSFELMFSCYSRHTYAAAISHPGHWRADSRWKWVSARPWPYAGHYGQVAIWAAGMLALAAALAYGATLPAVRKLANKLTRAVSASVGRLRLVALVRIMADRPG